MPRRIASAWGSLAQPVFYALSKTLDWLLAPLTWVLIGLALVAWSVKRRRPRAALIALATTAAILYAFSTDAVARSLGRYAESGARSTISPDATYDAVIVLGGFAGASPRDAIGGPPLSEAVERMLAAFTLLRAGRARQVLVSGGGDAHPVESEVVAEQLVAWGIDPARVVAEMASRNTYENAVESAKIIRARGWSRLLLVTSAMHMPRAAGCFKAAGVSFDTLAVDFHTGGGPEWLDALVPRAGPLATSTDVLRELAGRVVYRARGYAVEWP